MTPTLIGLVLTAAVLHAAWNAMAKSGGAPEFSIAGYQIVGATVCLLFVAFVPAPAVASWPMIAASVVIHNLYYFTLAQAYRCGDLSQVYPLFRGLAPVLVAAGAAVFVGEQLSVGALAGIGLVSAGLISLTLLGGKFGAISPAALRWGLATSVLIAAYTVVDGLGVRAAGPDIGHRISYILWLFIFEPFPIGIILWLTRRDEWLAFSRRQPLRIIAGGVASSAAYGLVIFAMSLGALAVVSSLRETSVIFAALIGTLLLGEPFGRQRLIAAALVATGVILLRLLADA